MKPTALIFSLCLLLPGLAGASWWAENDYTTGSNGVKKDSLTVLTHIKGKFMAGAAASFYRDTGAYKDRVYAYRLPLLYSGTSNILALTPFVYPVAPATNSGAKGARLYFQASLTEPDDESYLRLTAAGAWAGQDARRLDAQGNDLGKKSFSETALELQVEKSYFGQFFLLGSAATFSKADLPRNQAPVKPALDHADMACLGTFRQITALPEWVVTTQVSRSMKPEFASLLYIGYSKISFRSEPAASSAIFGLKLEMSAKTTLDFAYNLFKAQSSAYKNYYKILLRTVF
ncbi:MAG TPA: hypothetical protein PKI19_09630 [Elusimicrobiales bacterium]|nr:hypothetical protein [Elusimicrobiales bacterium]